MPRWTESSPIGEHFNAVEYVFHRYFPNLELITFFLAENLKTGSSERLGEDQSFVETTGPCLNSGIYSKDSRYYRYCWQYLGYTRR
jgi:hypothetical protein